MTISSTTPATPNTPNSDLESGFQRTNNNNRNELIASCNYIFSILIAFISAILGLIYGILMLVPAAPFETKMVGLGITLIVLSVIGVLGGLVFIICYCIIMPIILLPIMLCMN